MCLLLLLLLLLLSGQNLYNCGKVCLSLLGTWNGPGWDPAHSTLLQVREGGREMGELGCCWGWLQLGLVAGGQHRGKATMLQQGAAACHPAQLPCQLAGGQRCVMSWAG
jgi:hypothetical protein